MSRAAWSSAGTPELRATTADTVYAGHAVAWWVPLTLLGLITAALFMLAGSAKHGTGTRDIPELTGLAARMPMFSLVLIIAALASLGLPGLNGFVLFFALPCMLFRFGMNTPVSL